MFKYIDEKKLSEMTGRSVKGLQNDRWKKCGIPFVKFNRQVRYALEDVIEYMEKTK